MTNNHIGIRLGAAFAVLIAMLMGIGQLGLRRMKEIDESLRDITGRRSDVQERARLALRLSNRNSRITMEVFLVQDRKQIATLLAARAENTKKISELVREITSRCESEKEKQLLFTVDKARQLYIDSYLRALHLLVDEGKHDAAVAVMVNETTVALLKYHAAWEEFADFETDQIRIAGKQAEIENTKARHFAYVLIVLAISVALVTALFTTREITHEITARMRAKDEVSRLNATLEERVMRRTSELNEATERLNLQTVALEAAANAMMIADSSGTIVWVNHAFTTMTGYSKEEALGNSPRLLRSGVQPESYYAELWSTISSGKVWQGEIVNRRKDGTTYTEEMTITPVTQPFGDTTTTHFIAIKQDISERKRAEDLLRQGDAMLNATGEMAKVGGWELDLSTNELSWTREVYRIHEVDEGFVPNVKRAIEFYTPRCRPLIEQAVKRAIEHSESFDLELEIETAKNRRLWVKVVGRIRALNSGTRTLFGTFQDITERRRSEERVQYLAYYDALTDLPNRALLADRLSTAMASARRRKDKVALLFLDLDRFKSINDSFGHSFGDLVLQDVAKRLKRRTREQDTVARLGGDEFLIVLNNVKDISDVAVAAKRFMDAMTAEFVVQGHSLGITCSLGISIFPEHGLDVETLVKNADAAMYSAKDHGRNNFQFFAEEMTAQVVERLTLENSLRPALDKKQLFLVYQPQMDIATGKIIGLEALLRWQHPELGLVPPDKFIRIAENSGLILPIGEWVLRTACAQARKWQDEGLSAVRVAVNVSAVQFRQPDFCAIIGSVLHETGLAPQYLELELTESLLLNSADVTLSVIQELSALGVTLAIDDFGTGYSSFAYLRQFQVSKLKIDRSFIQDVAVNPDDAAIANAIISMAKSLSLKVIAEGVENEAQMSFLRAHLCDEIQGYYFSKPLSVDKVAEKLRDDCHEPLVRAVASAGQSSQENL